MEAYSSSSFLQFRTLKLNFHDKKINKYLSSPKTVCEKSLRGASPVNGSKNRYFFFIIIRLHMHSEIRM